jgi:AcrR family transcriptional regulator
MSRSTEQVRRDLLDAAARLAGERGIAAVTYRDVAAAAGASDSVLLRQFGTKNGLLVDAVVAPFTATLAEMIGVWGGGGSKHSFLRELYDGLAGNRGIVRIMLAAEAAGDDDPTLVAARTRLREVFAGLAEVSQSVGEQRGPSAFEPGLTARVVLAMTVAVSALDDLLFPEDAPSAEQLITALSELTAHGRAGPPERPQEPAGSRGPAGSLEPGRVAGAGRVVRGEVGAWREPRAAAGLDGQGESSAGTRRRPAELRAALLRAGSELFAEQGYEATTYRQIAKRAEVSPSVLFRHFGSKANLLVEAVAGPFAEFLTQFTSAWDGPGRRGGDRELVIREFGGELYQLIRQQRAVVRAMLSTLQSAEGDELMRQIGERMSGALRGLTSVAENYARQGPFPPDDSGILIRATIGMVIMVGALESWFLPDGQATPTEERLVDVMATLISRGRGLPPR